MTAKDDKTDQATPEDQSDIEVTPTGEKLHVVDTVEVGDSNQPTDAWGED